MEQDDVHYDRSEDGEAERHEAAEDQEKATNDLASGDSIDVVANEEGTQEVAGNVVRQGRQEIGRQPAPRDGRRALP